MTTPAIRLDALTKRYPNQSSPAVDRLDLDVPEGEIVMLVGPSGCGKTTTLEMINRLVEPTSGRIVLQGEDVTDIDVDDLRRRIGYAIQQIGLFPHRTIAHNIATVPRLLGWDRNRIRNRVDELLELVGLEPTEYRDRYPRELSGGQRQRVGVARAMAADPPVMLMDEPFGATDPITRGHLQREFLRIQEGIGKTIVFVTHDIDEAITMGDRIAILREGAQVAQYDTPQQILSRPADEFVVDFLGSGSLFRRLDLTPVAQLRLRDDATADPGTDVEELRRRAAANGPLLLLDADGRPSRWVTSDDLRDGRAPAEGGDRGVGTVLAASERISDALQDLLQEPTGAAPVVGTDGRVLGVLDLPTLHRAVLDLQRAAATDDAREREPAP